MDDVLGYANDEDALFKLLDRTLATCQKSGLQLNPSKCDFFKREVRCCGRIISNGGVKHDPVRISALMELPKPTSAKELQQFVCAIAG